MLLRTVDGEFQDHVQLTASSASTTIVRRNSSGAAMPPEVQEPQDAIASVPGITDAAVDKVDLSDVTESDFGLLPYADLPLGALKRTKGGLDNELAISVNFGITRDPKGLKALEFLSWWVRDLARAGEPMQIRSIALPPIGDQLGTSLRFCINYFYAGPEQDIGKLLSKVGTLADALNSAKSLYPQVIASRQCVHAEPASADDLTRLPP